MKITDAFLGEHGVFYAQLDHFERSLESDDLECVQRRAELLADALAPHAHLENELLFDPLDAASGGVALVGVMRDEHATIEAALAGIRAASDVERARTLLNALIQDARDHFGKEERLAFPMAEEVLGADELERLGEDWARRRGVHLGAPARAWPPDLR